MIMTMRRLLKGLGILIAVFAVMQAIPYGRTHANPRTVKEPAWDSPRTRELAERACFDCHSNHTNWPWYSNLAPFSWVVQLDVENARDIVNFSEWNRQYDLASYSGQRTREGNMPPFKYKLAHKEADLTPQERDDLARGLDATIGADNRYSGL